MSEDMKPIDVDRIARELNEIVDRELTDRELAGHPPLSAPKANGLSRACRHMARTIADTTPDKDKKPVEPMLARLEKALAKSGLAPTNFGYTYFGDPAFMRRIRSGRKMYKLRADAEKVCREYGV